MDRRGTPGSRASLGSALNSAATRAFHGAHRLLLRGSPAGASKSRRRQQAHFSLGETTKTLSASFSERCWPTVSSPAAYTLIQPLYATLRSASWRARCPCPALPCPNQACCLVTTMSHFVARLGEHRPHPHPHKHMNTNIHPPPAPSSPRPAAVLPTANRITKA